MERNPLEMAMQDPEKRTKLYIWINIAMIGVTFIMGFGVILFILIAFGIIHA